MQQMLSDESTYRPLERDPKHLWRTGWVLDYCSLRNADDSPWSIHDWEARLAEFHYFTDCRRATNLMLPCDLLCPLCLFQCMSCPSFWHHVRNSRAFVEFMRSQTLLKDKTLVTCDMTSLFTCIPTDLAIQVACCRLERHSSLPERTSLMVDGIMSLLSMCLDATFLSFGVKVYQWVKVLQWDPREERHWRESPIHLPLPFRFWKRYIDDTYCNPLRPDWGLPWSPQQHWIVCAVYIGVRWKVSFLGCSNH